MTSTMTPDQMIAEITRLKKAETILFACLIRATYEDVFSYAMKWGDASMLDLMLCLPDDFERWVDSEELYDPIEKFQAICRGRSVRNKKEEPKFSCSVCNISLPQRDFGCGSRTYCKPCYIKASEDGTFEEEDENEELPWCYENTTNLNWESITCVCEQACELPHFEPEEYETCQFCCETILVEDSIYTGYATIAPCETCDAMLCRKCLDGGDVKGECIDCLEPA